jgi:hypothetical protein
MTDKLAIAYAENSAALMIARQSLERLAPFALDVEDGVMDDERSFGDDILNSFVSAALLVARLERRQAEIAPQLLITDHITP